jgi:hypothetical protein
MYISYFNCLIFFKITLLFKYHNNIYIHWIKLDIKTYQFLLTLTFPNSENTPYLNPGIFNFYLSIIPFLYDLEKLPITELRNLDNIDLPNYLLFVSSIYISIYFYMNMDLLWLGVICLFLVLISFTGCGNVEKIGFWILTERINPHRLDLGVWVSRNQGLGIFILLFYQVMWVILGLFFHLFYWMINI